VGSEIYAMQSGLITHKRRDLAGCFFTGRGKWVVGGRMWSEIVLLVAWLWVLVSVYHSRARNLST
jgi:hypothetical protein